MVFPLWPIPHYHSRMQTGSQPHERGECHPTPHKNRIPCVATLARSREQQEDPLGATPCIPFQQKGKSWPSKETMYTIHFSLTSRFQRIVHLTYIVPNNSVPILSRETNLQLFFSSLHQPSTCLLQTTKDFLARLCKHRRGDPPPEFKHREKHIRTRTLCTLFIETFQSF